MATCGNQCEVYSRIVGYYRPVDQWNAGKKEEFKDRLEFSEAIAAEKEFSTLTKEQKIENRQKCSNYSVKSMISNYRIFSLPNCDKCAKVKEFLSNANVKGLDTNLGRDDGVAEFRSYYKKIKDNIQRNEDGSLPIPTVLFFDKEEKIIGTAHNLEQVKSILSI